MENNTKIAIGLAAAVVVAYLVFKKPKVNIGNLDIDFSSQGEKDAFYDAYSKQFGNVNIAPSGSRIETSYGTYFCIDTCMDNNCTMKKPLWSKGQLTTNDSNSEVPSKAWDEINKLLKTDFCASDPKSYSCYVQKGGGFMPMKRTPDYVMTQQEMEACNEDPRNCKM
jgi:hypothetical protein